MKLLDKVEMASCSVAFYCSLCTRLMLTQWHLPCRHSICQSCFSLLSNDDYIGCPLHQRKFHMQQVSRDGGSVEKGLAKLRVFCVKRSVGCPNTFSLKHILNHIEHCPHPIDKLEQVKQSLDLPDKATFVEKWEAFISPITRNDDIKKAIVLEEEEDDVDEQQFIRCLRKIQEDATENVAYNADEIDQSKADDGASKRDTQGQCVHYKSGDEVVEVVTSVTKSNRTNFSWKVKGLAEKVSDGGEVSSKWLNFSISNHLLAKFRLSVAAEEENEVIFNICFRYVDRRNELLRHHRTTLSIEPNGSGKRLVERIEEPCFASDGWTTTLVFEPVSLILLKPFDLLKINVAIEPLAVLYKTIGRNFYFDKGGVKYKWPIDDVKEKVSNLRDGSTSCLRSSYFYSGKTGYRIQAALRLNGDYFSAFLDFLVGEWDQQLAEHFYHTTTFVAKSRNGILIAEKHVYGDHHLFGDRIDNFIAVDAIEENKVITIKITVNV
ncbi:hypothetical protein CHUAL_013913 [Chamberlinius hualienensis]